MLGRYIETGARAILEESIKAAALVGHKKASCLMIAANDVYILI